MIMTALLIAVAVLVTLVLTRRRPERFDERDREERTRYLLGQARRMFPNEAYEYYRLDELYQSYYGELRRTRGTEERRIAQLRRDMILIHEAKLRALDEMIDFESQVVRQFQNKKVTQ